MNRQEVSRFLRLGVVLFFAGAAQQGDADGLPIRGRR